MSIFGAFTLFVVLILVYVVISEVFTVLFRFTGMPEDKARFQVISMLTNSGYTTQESETVTSSRSRRRLARITMLFGYAFTVTIVSSVVNIFLALKLSELRSVVWSLPWPLLILVGIYLLSRSRKFKWKFDRFTENIAEKIMFRGDKNYALLLDNFGDKVMAQVHMSVIPEGLRDKTFSELRFSENNGILVSIVKRGESDTELVTGETKLLNGDILVVFGEYEAIKTVFEITEAQ